MRFLPAELVVPRAMLIRSALLTPLERLRSIEKYIPPKADAAPAPCQPPEGVCSKDDRIAFVGALLSESAKTFFSS